MQFKFLWFQIFPRTFPLLEWWLQEETMSRTLNETLSHTETHLSLGVAAALGVALNSMKDIALGC